MFCRLSFPYEYSMTSTFFHPIQYVLCTIVTQSMNYQIPALTMCRNSNFIVNVGCVGIHHRAMDHHCLHISWTMSTGPFALLQDLERSQFYSISLLILGTCEQYILAVLGGHSVVQVGDNKHLSFLACWLLMMEPYSMC